MNAIGSPEWFNFQSKGHKYLEKQGYYEDLRNAFLEKFSPNCLKKMSGAELLRNVFGSGNNSMLDLLMLDECYRNFGSIGKYKYIRIVYQTNDGQWKYKEGSNSVVLSKKQAEEKAVYIRDLLLKCITNIENSSFETIYDYKKLVEKIKHIFFYQYVWVLKYYQMVFPFYFPGMYATGTLYRAMDILGLPYYGDSCNLINSGQISLFIRKCDVNNIIFNEIYANQWGWEKSYISCPYAKENYNNSSKPIKNINKNYYKIGTRKNNLSDEANKIEAEINSLNLIGEDREAVVKTRVNQSVFRELLLMKYNKCCLCGVSDPKFLVASHIKPWKNSSPEEKLDIDNGFLLCPNHDKVFDKGYISFDENGKIIISDLLSTNDKLFLNIHTDMKIKLDEENKKYLKYHRENVFNK